MLQIHFFVSYFVKHSNYWSLSKLGGFVYTVNSFAYLQIPKKSATFALQLQTLQA